MRAGRLLSLVSILSREGRTTAAELAERLEVSERTVLRDLEVLSGSGVPVYAVRGPGGGFQLLEGYAASRAADVRLPPGSPRGDTGRMTVRITEEGRRTAAVLGLLQPLRVRPPCDTPDTSHRSLSPEETWVTATCRIRSLSGTAAEVLALGPQVEVVGPPELREHVADLARRTAARYAGSPG